MAKSKRDWRPEDLIGAYSIQIGKPANAAQQSACAGGSAGPRLGKLVLTSGLMAGLAEHGKMLGVEHANVRLLMSCMAHDFCNKKIKVETVIG